jgi:hypothetical protein
LHFAIVDFTHIFVPLSFARSYCIRAFCVPYVSPAALGRRSANITSTGDTSMILTDAYLQSCGSCLLARLSQRHGWIWAEPNAARLSRSRISKPKRPGSRATLRDPEGKAHTARVGNFVPIVFSGRLGWAFSASNTGTIMYRPHGRGRGWGMSGSRSQAESSRLDMDVTLRCARLHVPDRRPERDALIAATLQRH